MSNKMTTKYMLIVQEMWGGKMSLKVYRNFNLEYLYNFVDIGIGTSL